MKRLSIITLAILMVAAVASADNGGMGGGSMGRGPGMGMGPGIGIGPGDGMGPGDLLVGSDGTAYVAKTVGSSGSYTTTVTAVRSAGTTAWTATLPTDAHGLRLSGSNLITSSQPRASDGTISSTLTALSTATGATAWTKTIAGHAEVAGTFNGGTYVVVVVPATTSGGTASRSLVALGNDGSTLWTISI